MSTIQHLGSVLAFTLFVAAPLPLGVWLVTLREEHTRRRLSLAQAALSLLTVWCVVQALVAHALGALHQLRFAGMLVAELLVFGVGGFILSRRPRVSGWVNRTAPITAADGLETVALLTLAFMGLIQLWWSAAMPVVDWDSWAFHMPHMAQWLQSGSFTRLAQGAERARNSYPYGWEALCTLFLTPFGEDVFVTFPNLVAWALIALATYLMARLWHAQRIHALACSTSLLAVPYIAGPLNSMHVDIPFAALFITSAYYGACWARSSDRTALGLCAATTGLACATRTTAPVYALLLAIWVLFIRRIARASRGTAPGNPPLPTGEGQGEGNQICSDSTERVYGRLRGQASIALTSLLSRWERKRSPMPAIVGFAVAILLGSFWYLKNLLEVGHVLGPGMPVTGPQSVRGSWAYLAARTFAFTFNPLQASSWKALMDRSFHELDAPFVALAAMAALWPIARLLDRRAHRNVSEIALALLLIGTGVAFIFTPLSAISGIQLRLGLPFFTVLAVAAAIGATRARLHAAVPITFAVIGAARTFSHSRLLFPLMLLALVWGVWRIPVPTLRLSRAQRFAVGALAALAIVLLTFMARERRERERHAMYGSFYAALEQRVSPHEPVAYLLSQRSYLFYGRYLARSVVYAPLNADESVAEWAERLRQQHIRIVAVGPWDENAADRATLERLMAPAGPLIAISGSGGPGTITLFQLGGN